MNVSSLSGADNAEARKLGFMQGVESKLVVEIRDSAEWETPKAYAKFQSMLAAHPDLQGVFCANDKMALGALKAVQEAARRAVRQFAERELDKQNHDYIERFRRESLLEKSFYNLTEDDLRRLREVVQRLAQKLKSVITMRRAHLYGTCKG